MDYKTQKRVVVTGLGMVSPLGSTVAATWDNLKLGTCATAYIRHFDATSWPTQIACEVRDWDVPDSGYFPHQKQLMSRASSFGVEAARQAMVDAGFESGFLNVRAGIAIGAGLGHVDPHLLAPLLSSLQSPQQIDLLVAMMKCQKQSHLIARHHPGTLATLLAEFWNITGPVSSTHTACASSTQAIGHAMQSIIRGTTDIMLVGGADCGVEEMLMAGFCLLGILSQNNNQPLLASRPFDKDRDGFVAAEGAGFLVLEEESHAMRRGARIYARLAGFGEAMSAFPSLELAPDGRGLANAMTEALTQASVTWDDVGYVNSHGTATVQNDAGEAEAIRSVVGQSAPFIGASKSLTGHMLAASGAVEAIFTLLALKEQVIPPNRNRIVTDGWPLNFAPNTLTPYSFSAAVSNSVGFGGSNASVVFVKDESHG